MHNSDQLCPAGRELIDALLSLPPTRKKSKAAPVCDLDKSFVDAQANLAMAEQILPGMLADLQAEFALPCTTESIYDLVREISVASDNIWLSAPYVDATSTRRRILSEADDLVRSAIKLRTTLGLGLDGAQ